MADSVSYNSKDDNEGAVILVRFLEDEGLKMSPGKICRRPEGS
jgi:hypothetical protein